MALIKCKECATEVSSKAETCPKCGARFASKQLGCNTLIGVVFLGTLIIFAISNGSNNDSSSSSTNTNLIQTNENQPLPASNPEPVILGTQWSYSQVADAMSKGMAYHAVVSSSNTVEFDFPYAGAQHARLNLRIDPRYGKDIIFSIEKGQILCTSYENCTVLVRFDDEQATNYSAVGSSDNSTETIFIYNYGRFVEKMLKAKQVLISTNIYQQGAPVFEFDISNFDLTKYKPKK